MLCSLSPVSIAYRPNLTKTLQKLKNQLILYAKGDGMSLDADWLSVSSMVYDGGHVTFGRGRRGHFALKVHIIEHPVHSRAMRTGHKML